MEESDASFLASNFETLTCQQRHIVLIVIRFVLPATGQFQPFSQVCRLDARILREILRYETFSYIA